ncbi:MAG: hypothetical protein AAF799_04415 [Myxococcota bacterium]
MKSCPSCDRHVRASEPSCPFCRAPLREVGAPLIAVLGLAGVLVGCSDDGTLPSGGDGSGGANVTTTATSPADDGNQDSFTSTSNGAADSSGGAFDTTTTDADSGVDDSNSGAGFIYGGGADGGVENECDIIEQDCPDGEKCMPWANDGGEAWNATRCAPISDTPAAAGEPCTMVGSPTSGIDDCDATSMCFHVDPDALTGTCVSFCESIEPPTCADAERVCAVANDEVIAACLLPCDLEAPECPEGQECFPLKGDTAVCF